ncbi:MAG: SMC family ATPase [Actinobacteria bacterium]|nr:SMC family ATPase [Actinomycetota bacterium]
MRPIRIEAEGFLAYKDRVTVDFSDVEFFSLTGPTGSGKSSLIDAMVFALYGRVPRLGGKAVAPAIKAGADRARVRFFFEADGVVYDATRMAERTSSGGATVREARLQRGDTVLAGRPGDVTAAVEELLRLSFDDFTRTVVLPQGDFARFLKDPPRERQELLRTLLGLDVLVEVRELSKTRTAVASDRAERARRSLESLDLPDEETLAAAVAHRDALQALSVDVAERERSLLGLGLAAETARTRHSSLADAAARLDRIEAPPRLEELESLAADARSRFTEAEESHRSAAERLEQLQAKTRALPSPDQVAGWKRALSRLHEIEDRLEHDSLAAARATLAEAESRLESALARLGRAREEVTAARREHSAHLLAAGLEPGRPCPVCATEVSEVPILGGVPAVERVEAAEKAAEDAVASLRGETEEARAAVVAAETARSALLEQRESLQAELATAPGSDELERVEAQVTDLQASLETVGELVRRTEADTKAAGKELEEVAEASRRVAKRLTEAQLTVADLDPPVPDADDVTVQWKELMVWRDQSRERLQSDMELAREALAETEAHVKEARQELLADLERHGLEPVEPFAAQLAGALQTARSTVERYQRSAEEAVALTGEIEASMASAAVANALANHLRSNGFEQWLMAGALADLVDGANDLLRQLSDGGYSLQSDDSGGFSIIDHRNADETRPISTLSGGETFQSSLALALSLAETLAAQGNAKLEAVIIDEGFGSLDTDESLDIAGSVLENLTGGGLMVGVITHVKELAARAAVRYEVIREPTGARVRLVS